MFHPLIHDISKIKDQALEEKIFELNKKYHIAASMGHGAICNQIALILDMYNSEMARRNQQKVKDLLKTKNKDLDDLINVDK